MSPTEVFDDDELPPGIYADIAIRLADEGVPLRAVARVLQKPCAGVRAAIQRAVERGQLVSVPRDDWPIGTARDRRVPDAGDPWGDDTVLAIACCQVFHVTRLQADMLVLLLRRPLATREALHDRGHDNTQIKIVDVVICHLRKKLGVYGIDISTLWGTGYSISPEQRQKAFDVLTAAAYAAAGSNPPSSIPKGTDSGTPEGGPPQSETTAAA